MLEIRAFQGAQPSSLLSRQCRARNEGNLRLTPPCSRELQVFDVVGHDDERADVAAGLAAGDNGLWSFG